MRDLTIEEMGHVYGAGGSSACKPNNTNAHGQNSHANSHASSKKNTNKNTGKCN